MATISNASTITVDGNFTDWTASELIDNPGDAVPGYSLYGTVQNDNYFIAIQGTGATDPVIGPGTTIWLNTDQNTTTGYSTATAPLGADYNITFVNGAFYLYTGSAAQTLVSATPLSAALSSDGKSLEIAIPRSLVTPASGPAPASINIAAQIDTGTTTPVYLPGDYTSPEFAITDPATLTVQAPTHKVAIVYSDTTAALYFSQTAYSDLFMAAQNQARMAGVSYDIIDELQLTNINNLIGYDTIIFPSMADVNTAQLPAIMSTLTSAVYNYHIGIITAGDFLTNDQTGAPLPGNSYSNMETLLGLVRSTSGNNGAETVTANDVTNTIMKGYTAGQVIETYASEGYAAYQGVGGTATDVLVNQNVTGVGTLPGVVQTTTGGTNVHFATTDLLGDSNLLSNAIQTVALGTQPGVALHMSRDAGVVAVRMDMDQSQFPADVSPAGGGSGIYGTLIPILQQWNQQYDFVGSYFINIGDTPTAADPATTNWAVSLPYYQDLLAMGSEIGNHSYTHLLNPPTTTVTETTTADTPAGSNSDHLGRLAILRRRHSRHDCHRHRHRYEHNNFRSYWDCRDPEFGSDFSDRRRHDSDLRCSGREHQFPADCDNDQPGPKRIRQSLHLRLRVPTVCGAGGGATWYSDRGCRRSRRQRDVRDRPEHPALLPIGRRDRGDARIYRLSDRWLDRRRFRLPERDRLHEPKCDRHGLALYRAKHDVRFH